MDMGSGGAAMMLKALGLDPQKAMATVTSLQNVAMELITVVKKLDDNVTEMRAELASIKAQLAPTPEEENGTSESEPGRNPDVRSGVGFAGNGTGSRNDDVNGPDAGNASSPGSDQG